MMRHLLIAACTLCVVSLSAGTASAAYVCEATYRPETSTTMGSAGYIQFSIYNDPGCTGGLIGSYYLCSTSATSTNCSFSADYRYERSGLLAVFQSLVVAAANDMWTVGIAGTCNGGGSGCGTYVTFSSFP